MDPTGFEENGDLGPAAAVLLPGGFQADWDPPRLGGNGALDPATAPAAVVDAFEATGKEGLDPLWLESNGVFVPTGALLLPGGADAALDPFRVGENGVLLPVTVEVPPGGVHADVDPFFLGGNGILLSFTVALLPDGVQASGLAPLCL